MEIKRSHQTARWSQLVERGDMVYLSGVIAETWDADIITQTQEMFAQVDALLEAAGTDKSAILSMTFWIADLADYQGFNDVYDAWVDKENLPARATVKAELVDPRLRIEVMTIAAK